jgi:hypothetical protein
MPEAVSSPAFRRVPEWLGTLMLVPIAMAIDSRAVAERFAYGQWVANALVFCAFLLIVRRASPRMRGVMWWGLVVGTAGEIVFSLFIGMYEYRLGNVPAYVPPGHSMLYAAIYYFVHEPFVRRHRLIVSRIMLAMASGFALLWLVRHHDVYGFACTLVFYYFLWRHESSRMFFLAMYLLVAYLELFGTGFGCWYWHPTLLDKFDWMPSGNPPSGISVFYFGFDAACLEYYARHRGMWQRYLRLKARADARLAKTPTEALAAAE